VLSILGFKMRSNTRGEAVSTPLLRSIIEEVQCRTGFDGPERSGGDLPIQRHEAGGSFDRYRDDTTKKKKKAITIEDSGKRL
jgi:hypothetical protein